MKNGILAKLCSFLIIIVIFLSLVLALNLGGSVPDGQMPMLGLGLLSYSFAIYAIILSCRPKFIEKGTSLNFIYTLHAVAGVLLLLTGIAHGAMEFMAQKDFTVEPWVMPTGIAAIVFFLIVVLVGALGLSGKIKMKKRIKREAGIMVHRISLLAVILVYGHMMGVTFLRNNVALLALGGAYLALGIICFIIYTVRGRVSRKHQVIVAEKAGSDVHRFVLSPINKGIEYRAGQYAFIRFIDSSLPKESHPFSIVSSSGDLEFLIKESGDFTSRLSEAKAGDIVSVDGPYGNFFKENEINGDKPVVLLAGGIGITPFLSFLRCLKEKGIERECHLLWGVRGEKDAFLIEELEELKNALPSFSYSIAYSNEAKDGNKRRVDLSFMEECGIDALYEKADFHICGPAGFNASLKKTLLDKDVDKKRVTLEEFSF